MLFLSSTFASFVADVSSKMACQLETGNVDIADHGSFGAMARHLRNGRLHHMLSYRIMLQMKSQERDR